MRVYLFKQANCAPCEVHGPRILRAAEAVGLPVTVLDVADPEARALFDRHRCRGTPTLLALDEEGKRHTRMMGALVSEGVLKILAACA